MKRSIIIVILLIVFQSFLVAQHHYNLDIFNTFAYPDIVVKNWDIEFPGPGLANDFHIYGIVKSQNNNMPVLTNHWQEDLSGATGWYMNGYSITQDSGNPEHWNFAALFKTAGGTISVGTIVHFGLEFVADTFNYMRIEYACWTYNGFQVGDPVELTGFEVTPDSWLILIIDFASPIELTVLEGVVTELRVPLGDLNSEGLGNPGEPGNSIYRELEWTRFQEDIVLEPGEIREINMEELGLYLNPDQYIWLRANSNFCPLWFGHEHSQ